MSKDALIAHLKTGHTHVCQCWSITRRDGVTFGFTDHDMPLTFDGITFRADSGMAAKALASATGLSVNNSEALGLLQSDTITQADIQAGRYDGADVTNWTVCWDDVSARKVNFRGHIGQITLRDGAFEAELRGLTDALNQPQGRSYLKRCSAVLGDASCGVDLTSDVYQVETTLTEALGETVFRLPVVGYNDGWFTQGRLIVLDGPAKGLTAAIKLDHTIDGWRHIAIWDPFGIAPLPGSAMRLQAGCDKTSASCRVKFSNLANYQGFPHIPGDDWLISIPRSNASNDGGSLTG